MIEVSGIKPTSSHTHTVGSDVTLHKYECVQFRTMAVGALLELCLWDPPINFWQNSDKSEKKYFLAQTLTN